MAGGTQALNALAEANQMREARSSLKKRLAKNEIPLIDALEEPCAQGMPLMKVLTSQKRWGPARARKFLKRQAVSFETKVGDMSADQLQRVVLNAPNEPVARAGYEGSVWRCAECGTRLKEPASMCRLCMGDKGLLV